MIDVYHLKKLERFKYENLSKHGEYNQIDQHTSWKYTIGLNYLYFA